MKTELELSEMYWKNPEYNERMSWSAFKKLAAVLSESEQPTDEDIENAANEWLNKHRYPSPIISYEQGAKDMRDNKINKVKS